MKSKPIPIPHRSNPAKYKVVGSPRVVNAYAETAGNDNKADMTLVAVAGMKTFVNGLDGKCRGLIYLEGEDKVYSVNGSQVYQISENGTSTAIGLISGTNNVSIARNDADTQQLCILSDGDAWFVEDGILTKNKYTSTSIIDNEEITTELEFTDVTYCGGFFVFALPSGKFYVAGLQNKTIDELDFATAEGNPDGLTAVHGEINTLYLIGPKTTEIWAVASDAFPFAKVGGAHLTIGSLSKHTVKSFDNSIMMVGSDNIVYQVRGYDHKPISSNEVSRLIEDEIDKSKIVAFTHSRGNNKFYTLQGTNWTREYNALTGMWADREDINKSNWHCAHSIEAWGKKLFGDSSDGNVFEADYKLHTDNGNVIPWGFDTQTLHNAPHGLSFDRLALDMEVGDGISKSDDGKVMIQWSDDGGRSWEGYRQSSLGKEGEYNTRIREHRLGQCGEKGRIFRVRITDAVDRAIAGMYGNIETVET